jgi:hypothetical protein
VDTLSLSSNWYFSPLLAIIAAYYLLLLSNGTFQLFAPEMLDRAFDNMLLHLLHGEFTIDREAIDFEAFTRDGKTYAYFGVFPALLRLVAMPFTDIAQAELARLSCLTAVVIFVALQLRMLLIVHHSLPPGSRRPELLAVMVAATLLSGPQLYILGSSWIYHEPILWSAAMAAAFNLVIVRAAFSAGSLRGRELVLLAALAGLTINTRPSVGVALYLDTILFVAWTMWCRRSAPDRRARVFSSKEARPITTLLPPIAVLGLAAVAVGVINFERWGNPLTFADFRLYDWLHRHAEFADALRNYGEFDVGRVWIGALYYATGIPFMLKAAPPFAEFLHARYQGIEALPIIPLLTNPITVLLAGVGLYRLWWRPELPARSLAMLRFALVGHASTVLLILAAMYLALRYRFDFAPFMTLAALIGYRSVSITAAGAQEPRRKQLRIAAIGLCVLGILSSHYVLLIHKVWSIAVPMEVRLALLPFAPFAHAAFEP